MQTTLLHTLSQSNSLSSPCLWWHKKDALWYGDAYQLTFFRLSFSPAPSHWLSERKVKRARRNSNSLLPNHPPASWMCFTWLTHFEQYFVQLLTHINNHIFLLRTCEPVCIAVSVNERDYGQGMNIFIWYVFIVSEREQVKRESKEALKNRLMLAFWF